jgi:hypothetical protein
MSSAFNLFVLFVFFVVKQFCASARGLLLHPFSLGTHSKRQRAALEDEAADLFPVS